MRTKSCKFDFKILTLTLTLICINCVNAKKESPSEPLRIGLRTLITTEQTELKKYSINPRGPGETNDLTSLIESGTLTISKSGQELTYLISQQVRSIQISCNSTVPISWISEEEEMRDSSKVPYYYMTNYYVTDLRSWEEEESEGGGDLEDPQTQVKVPSTYQSILELYGVVYAAGARNFTCFNLADPSIQKSIFIFWQGQGGSLLVHAGESFDVRSKDGGKTVILPCRVTRPDVNVLLYKETDDGYNRILTSENLTFSPKVGFTLKLSGFKRPYGHYRCVSEDEPEDDKFGDVRVNVLRVVQNVTDPSASSFRDLREITGNATFSYDQETRQLKCCSTSRDPPNFRVIFCSNPLSCRARRKYLARLTGQRTWSVQNGSCAHFSVNWHEAALYRCKGDGIDVAGTFVTSVPQSGLYHMNHNETMFIYFRSSEIDPSKLTGLVTDLPLPYYTTENITIFSNTNYYYFTFGLHWALRWKNGTVQNLDASIYQIRPEHHGPGGPYLYRDDYDEFRSLTLEADPNMDAIIVHIPVWNSTKIFKKELKVEIKDPILPQITLSVPPKVNWDLNETEKVIVCEVNGEPSPFVTWLKNNETLLMGFNTSIPTAENETVTSNLTIERVTSLTAGNYSCRAQNFAGVSETILQVEVEGEDTSGPFHHGFILAFTILSTLTLILGILGLTWKLSHQKKIISHLTRVVFRDNLEVSK